MNNRVVRNLTSHTPVVENKSLFNLDHSMERTYTAMTTNSRLVFFQILPHCIYQAQLLYTENNALQYGDKRAKQQALNEVWHPDAQRSHICKSIFIHEKLLDHGFFFERTQLLT